MFLKEFLGDDRQKINKSAVAGLQKIFGCYHHEEQNFQAVTDCQTTESDKHIKLFHSIKITIYLLPM